MTFTHIGNGLYTCLSTDTKVTVGMTTNSMAIETNTGNAFTFTGGAWVQVIAAGGGGGGGGSGGGVANSYTTSGTGSATVNIPHGFGSTPAVGFAFPRSDDAFGEFTTDVDATNIILTYSIPPLVGTDNLTYFFYASAASFGAGGEVNTYSTIGTGTPLTLTKVATNFPFKGLAAASNLIEIDDDIPNNNVTMDVNQENLSIAWSQLTSVPTSFTPIGHKTSHQIGGSDELRIDTIGSGTDITTNNASTSKHGLLRKLSNVSTEFLNGTGNWSTPAAASPNAPYLLMHEDVSVPNARYIQAGEGVTFNDKGADNNIVWSVNHRILGRFPSLEITNTAAETDLLNYVIPGGTLATGGVGIFYRAIHIRMMGLLLQNTTVNQQVTVRVKLNDVEMYSDTTTSSMASSAVPRTFYFDLILFSDGDNDKEGLGGTISIGNDGTALKGYGNLGTDEVDAYAIVIGADPGQDATVDMTLRITVQLSNANPAFTVTRKYAYIDQIVC